MNLQVASAFLCRWFWLDMILVVLVFLMWWKCFLPKSQKPFILLQQCWLVGRVPLLLIKNRFLSWIQVFSYTMWYNHTRSYPVSLVYLILHAIMQPSSDLMQQAQNFIYANGKDNPPTSIFLDKTLLTDLLYNRSPSRVLHQNNVLQFSSLLFNKTKVWIYQYCRILY